MSRRFPTSLLLFIGSFFFFWLFTSFGPITDPVESNYALPAKEMLESGNWLYPTIYGEPWFDKPILVYWLTALSFKLFGIHDGAARFMPALSSALGISLAYSFGSRVAGRMPGLLAAAILATGLQYFFMSKAVVTDSFLLVSSSAGLAYFYLGYMRYKGSTRWYIWMYPCLAIAVLAKGPIGLLLPGLIIALFLLIENKWSELLKMHLLLGTFLFALVSLPWFIAMYLRYGQDFVEVFLGVHNLLRATVPEHPENNVFYFYPVLFILSLLPWTGLAIRSICCGFMDAWKRKQPFQRFLLLWIGSYFVFYMLAATKYPTYLFPTVFPTAILTGFYLFKVPIKWPWLEYFLPIWIWIIGLGTASAIYLTGPAKWTVPIIFLLVGAFHSYYIRKKSTVRLFSSLFVLAVLLELLAAGLVLPEAVSARSEKHLPKILRPYEQDHLGFFDKYSTSYVYYGGPIVPRVLVPERMMQPTDGAISWGRKYIMPEESLEQFAQTREPGKRNILLVPHRGTPRKLFEKEAPNLNYKVLGNTEDWEIIEILPRP